MIHLYGIVDELDGLPRLAGIEGAPLERRRVGGLELVVSSTRAPRGEEVPREWVLKHAEVVEDLMSHSGAVLPARFGHAFGGEDELAAAVESKAGELARGLRLVRGCVEFGLRVVGPVKDAATSPVISSGADYMRARLAEAKRRERLVEELHEPLARLSRTTAVNRGEGRSLLEAVYLVRAANVSAFRAAVRRLETARGELTVVCTGPWPPYSFAGGGNDRP